MENQPFRIGILGSGKGSNFLAIADAMARGELPIELSIVLSDVAEAGILGAATVLGIPARHIPPGMFRTKLDESAEAAFVKELSQAHVDLVVLAGFMRVIKGELLKAYQNRIINIHPSLLPAFPGLQAWKQALDHGVKVTGCTVHYVDAGVDSGPIISQQPVMVRDGDTAESLHERIQSAEHELYPRCIGWIARKELEIRGRTVWRRPNKDGFSN